jgi:hypothetical protein
MLNRSGRYVGSPRVAGNVAHTAFIVAYDESGNPISYRGYAVHGATAGSTVDYCRNHGVPSGSGDSVCGGLVRLLVVSPFGGRGGRMTVDTSDYSVAATVEWLFGLNGPRSTGMDNPGLYDHDDRWTDPGFPTFEWLLGISGNGYGARD